MAEGLVKDGEFPEEENDTKFEVKKELVIVLSDSEEDNDKSDNDGDKRPECAVCLQSCVHPARLPCGHIFCFLCLKGIAHGSKKCAMCRHPIPPDYLDNPDLVETPTEQPREAPEEEGESYQWYYEGRNGGWWQYEQRMSEEIEEMTNAGITRFEILICGSLYVIDTLERIQYRKDRQNQSRRILRELPCRVVKKGVAGIR